MKLLSKIKNRYQFIIIFLFILFFALAFSFIFKDIYKHFLNALLSLFNSFIYYFHNLINPIGNNVNDFYYFIIAGSFPGIDLPTIPLPEDQTIFGLILKSLFFQFFSKEYFSASMVSLARILSYVNLFILIILLLIIGNILITSMVFSEKNPAIVGFTRNTIKFDNFIAKFKIKLNKFIDPYKFYLRKGSFLNVLLKLSILFYFQIINIGIVFLSYIFILCSNIFRLDYLYHSFYSLFYLAFPVINFFPLIFWFIVAYFLFNRWRLNKAKAKLIYLDYLNKNFVETLGVSVFIDGVSGSGKSTIGSLISIYKEEQFRNQAYNKLNKFINYFPDFDFQSFTKYLDYLINNRICLNRIQLKDFIEKRYINFFDKLRNGYKDINNLSELSKKAITFNYNNWDKIDYYNGLVHYSLEEVLVLYSELYFVYSRDSLGLISNIPLNLFLDKVNDIYFPSVKNYWLNDGEIKASATSGVINYDSIRLGKTFNKESPVVDSLVVLIDEIDKERGNQYSWKGLDRHDYNANLLNDKLDWYINTARHGNLIDNDVYVSFIYICQREGALSSSLVQSSESILDIAHSQKEKKNAISKFVFVENKLAKLLGNFFNNLSIRLMNSRNYHSLFFRFIRKSSSLFNNYVDYLNNYFGYSVVTINKRDPKGLAENSNVKFFIINKRIYANNFSSDGLKSLFINKFKYAKTTFVDERKFNGLNQTIDDLAYSNSYFYNDLNKNYLEDEVEKEEENNEEVNGF